MNTAPEVWKFAIAFWLVVSAVCAVLAGIAYGIYRLIAGLL